MNHPGAFGEDTVAAEQAGAYDHDRQDEGQIQGEVERPLQVVAVLEQVLLDGRGLVENEEADYLSR